jgi:hypothetical protein
MENIDLQSRIGTKLERFGRIRHYVALECLEAPVQSSAWAGFAAMTWSRERKAAVDISPGYVLTAVD